MRSEKGITLVALIITIIVMLILVTVSVTIALQTGLFEAASSAAQGTESAAIAENDLASGQVQAGQFSGDIGTITHKTTF